MNVSMENNKNGYKWITKLFREVKIVGKTFSVRRLLSVKKKKSKKNDFLQSDCENNYFCFQTRPPRNMKHKKKYSRLKGVNCYQLRPLSGPPGCYYHHTYPPLHVWKYVHSICTFACAILINIVMNITMITLISNIMKHS